MGEFSISHWLIILVVVLLFVGPSKLPGLGKSLGEAIRGFKKGLNEEHPDKQAVDPNHQISPGQAARTESVKQDEKMKS
jgi:sec-independent protein translocase protein TatA